MSYTKLSSTLLTSSLWGESANVRIVWITMLALANKHGEVASTVPGLARLASVPIQAAEEALDKFLSPDPYSRTPDDDGRRIEKIEGGWALLNYSKYREEASKEEQKAATARRVQRHREKRLRNQEVVTCNGETGECNGKSVTCNASVTENRDIAEAEAEADLSSDEERENAPAPKPPASEFHERHPKEAANQLDALLSKINSLHPDWGKIRPTYPEQRSLAAAAASLSELTHEDWETMRAFMDAIVPKGKFWQPRTRSQFLEHLSDVVTHAFDWKRDQLRTPSHS